MISIINIIIIICCIIILRNFYVGGIIYLLHSFILPSFVSFNMGGVSVNANDLFLIFMIASFLIHKSSLSASYPITKVLKLFSFYVIPAVLVCLLASFVPKGIQYYQFAKVIIYHTVLPVLFCFYFLNTIDTRVRFIRCLTIVAIVIGFYGVMCYVLRENPYIKILNLLYIKEYEYEYFLYEVRGGLSGRISGTMNHPLTWGQLWGILVAFFVMVKDKINPVLFKAVIVLGCLNVLFSGSRTALVALFPILVCYAVASGGLKVFQKIGIYAFVGVVLSYSLSDKMQTYIESAVFFWDQSKSNAAEINGSNVDMRINQIETTVFDVSKENLLFGYGLGYQEYSSKKNIRNSAMLGFESVFFQIMYEQGVVGVICFFVFLFQFYLFGIKGFKKNKKILFLGYCSSYLLSILFTGIQDTFSSYLFLGTFLIVFGARENVCERQIGRLTRS